MHVILRFLKFLLTLFTIYVVVILVIGGVLFFAPDVWSPPLLRQIEKISQSRFGIELKADRLKWVGFWPMVWKMENPRIHIPELGLKGAAEGVLLHLSGTKIDGNWARPKVDIGIQLAAPRLEWSQSKGAVDHAPSPSAGEERRGPIPLVRPAGVDLSLWVEVIDGSVTVQGVAGGIIPVQLEKIQLKAALPSARADVWRPTFGFQSQVGLKLKDTVISQPLGLELPSIELGQDRVKVQKGSLKAAELPFAVDGFYDFTDGATKWNLIMPVTEVAKIPVSFLPAGNWAGTFSGAFHLDKEARRPLKATGQLQTDGLTGNLRFENDSVRVDGPVTAQGGLRFAYAESLRLDNFSFAADLKNTLVEALPHFKKPAGIDMLVEFVADGDGHTVVLRRASLLLAHLKILGSGQMGLGDNGELKAGLTWPATPLNGLEKVFLVLNQAPLRGLIEGDLEVWGPWRRPAEMTINLKSLKLAQMAGRVDWKSSGGLRIAGGVGGNATLAALVKDTEVQSASLDAGFDLSQLTLTGHDIIQKPGAMPLKAQVSAALKARNVELSHFKLSGNPGDVVLSGNFRLEKDKVPMRLRLVMANAKVENWLKFLIKPPVQMSGEVSGALEVSGQYNHEEALAASPLKTRGQLSLVNGVLTHKPAPVPAPPAKTLPAVEPPAAPLLPNWPIIRTSDIAVSVSMPKLVYGDLQLLGLNSKLRLANGQITGTASIADAWGGVLQAQKIVVSPLVGPPGLELQATARNLQMGSLLAFFSPKLKGYMKGVARGDVSMLGPIPSGMASLKNLSASGDLAIVNGQFLTWELQSKINDKLRKVGLGSKGVRNKDLTFKADTRFALSDGAAKLSHLGLLTEDRDELKLRGTILLDMTLDLAGTAFVASQRVGGAVAAANSDASGRLAVPLQIRGSVMDPEFSFAEATLKQMLVKAGEAEAKKALAQAEEKLKAEARKQLDKNKDKVKEDVKQKLKGIFGK